MKTVFFWENKIFHELKYGKDLSKMIYVYNIHFIFMIDPKRNKYSNRSMEV